MAYRRCLAFFFFFFVRYAPHHVFLLRALVCYSLSRCVCARAVYALPCVSAHAPYITSYSRVNVRWGWVSGTDWFVFGAIVMLFSHAYQHGGCCVPRTRWIASSCASLPRFRSRAAPFSRRALRVASLFLTPRLLLVSFYGIARTLCFIKRNARAQVRTRFAYSFSFTPAPQ